MAAHLCASSCPFCGPSHFSLSVLRRSPFGLLSTRRSPDWLGMEHRSAFEVRISELPALSTLSLFEEPSITEASLRIAVTRMYCLITAFDPSVLTDKLAASPATYARLLDVLVKLTGGALKFERHRESQREKLPLSPPLLP